MVLLGVLALEPESGTGQPPYRSPRQRSSTARNAVSALSKQLDEPLVAEVPRSRDDDARPGVCPAVVRRECSTRDRPDHVPPSDHGPAERVAAEDRLGRDVVDEVVRRVLDHGDLLEDDLTLGVDVVERRTEDHVCHHVERRLEPFVGDTGVDDGRLA